MPRPAPIRPAPASPAPGRVWPGWLAGSLIVAAVGLAYANSLSGPFLFDDVPTILENPSVRHWWNLGEVLAPQRHGGLPVGGRPVANLSLAVNWALGAERPGGYHALNILIHAAAALTLFGLVRRTLRRPLLSAKFGAAAQPLALMVALVWALHPLQTEAVTYVSQRVESLMGLFYLLTLYAFVRGAEAARPVGWLVLSILACLLGMGTKEVMVSAPLLVLLYDRTFVAGSLREAWRRRWLYYLGLAATWLLLAELAAQTQGRGGTAGFGAAIPVWTYFLTQCHALILYLRLAFWPVPLVFDYGTWTVTGPGDVWLQALLLLGLAGATGWALWRRPVWGLAGIWFFAILAPSSSVVPIASQTMAEHRMYLALVALVLPLVLGLYVWLGRRTFAVGAVLAVVLGGATAWRNTAYRSQEAIWTDTVAKRPDNPRAHHNLGIELARQNRLAEAVAAYEIVLRLSPNDAEAHNNVGNHFLELGRVEEAVSHFTTALRLKPGFVQPRNNLGNVHLRAGRLREALACYEDALRLDPHYAEAHYNAGNALVDLGRKAEAVPHYEQALLTKPDDVDTCNNLATVLLELGRLPEAVARYAQAVQLQPDHAIAHRNLILTLEHLGRNAEALAQCEIFLRRHPDDQAMRQKLSQLQRAVADR